MFNDDNNPYAPPRMPELPREKPASKMQVGEAGMRWVAPLLNHVVNREMPGLHHSGIFSAPDPIPYFYQSQTHPDDQAFYRFINDLCDLRTEPIGPNLNAPYMHYIVSCDLQKPVLIPPPLSGEDEVNIVYSGQIIIDNAQKISKILEKYYPDKKDPYGVIGKCETITKHIQACTEPNHLTFGKSPEISNRYLHELLKPSNSLLSYNINSGYARRSASTGEISHEDILEMQHCVSEMVNAYDVSKEHFDRGLHHALYEQPKHGLEIKQEKPKGFSKCTSAIGSVFRKVWPKKLNPDIEQSM